MMSTKGEKHQLDNSIKMAICKAKGAEDLPLPKYMTPGSVGMDLVANVSKTICINPGEFKAIPCGIIIQLPLGYEAQVRPRSGLALKHGITLLNSPGTIDTDYRGEIKAILINHGKQEFFIERGDRIAQLVIAKVAHVNIFQTPNLTETERGEGGFGHTGL